MRELTKEIALAKLDIDRKSVLEQKAKEYALPENRFRNFELAGAFIAEAIGVQPQDVSWNIQEVILFHSSKHFASYVIQGRDLITQITGWSFARKTPAKCLRNGKKCLRNACLKGKERKVKKRKHSLLSVKRRVRVILFLKMRITCRTLRQYFGHCILVVAVKIKRCRSG